MNTALKTNVINFNSYREQRLQSHGATATHHESASYDAAIHAAQQPVVVWWPVWVLVPQQPTEAQQDNVVTIQ